MRHHKIVSDESLHCCFVLVTVVFSGSEVDARFSAFAAVKAAFNAPSRDARKVLERCVVEQRFREVQR